MSIIRENLGKKHRYYTTITASLAALYKLLGDYEQAKSLLIESLKIIENNNGKENIGYARTMQELAGVYLNFNDHEEAEKLYTASLNIIKTRLGPTHLQYAAALNNIAVFYEKIGNIELSKTYFLKTLTLDEQNYGKQHPFYAITLNSLAILNEQLGNYQEAEKQYLQTLRIRSQLFDKSHPEYIKSLTELATFYNLIQQDQLAWQYLQQAINQLTQNQLNEKIDSQWAQMVKKNSLYLSNRHLQELVKILDAMYKLLSKSDKGGKKEEKVLVTNLAIHLLRLVRDSYANDQDKLRILQQSHIWLNRLLENLDLEQNFDQAFKAVEFHKSILLMEATRSTKATQIGHLPDSLREKEASLNGQYILLQSLLLQNNTLEVRDSLRAKFNEVSHQVTIFKNRLKQKYPNYIRNKYFVSNLIINDLQNKLFQNQAILEYVIMDSCVYIFYMGQTIKNIFKIPIPEDQLKGKIKDYHQLISQPFHADFDKVNFHKSYNHLVDLSHWFYQNLLYPVVQQNSVIDELIIIPDGELAHLPFETFITKKVEGKLDFAQLPYVMNQFAMSYQHSSSLWLFNQQNQNESHQGQILNGGKLFFK